MAHVARRSCQTTDRLWVLLGPILAVEPARALPWTAATLADPLSRKEVIQPHLPIRLPCYDFTPVMKLTVVSALLAVKLPTSGEPHSHGVTGGVYKTRERIHRSMLICDY